MKTLVLDGTAISIQVAMTTSAATTNPTFVSTYADNAGSGITEGATDGALNGSTDVTVVPAPSGANRRVIKGITIFNGDTASVTVLIKYDNNATQRTLVKVTLAVGDTWTTDGVFDANGNLKQTMGTVNLATQVTGTLPIANGGTGATSLASASIATYTGTETLTNKTLTNPTVTNYVETVVAIGNSGTTQTLALTNGTVQTVTMTGNCTFTMPTATAGKSFILIAVQDGTGSRTATFTSVKWAGGTAPTLTTTATTGRDILTFVADGTNWYGTYAQAFA
tara:strand:+ start:116 stop:955 length:840 start_codon:yes stop_codon:yes gene_type:complete